MKELVLNVNMLKGIYWLTISLNIWLIAHLEKEGRIFNVVKVILSPCFVVPHLGEVLYNIGRDIYTRHSFGIYDSCDNRYIGFYTYDDLDTFLALIGGNLEILSCYEASYDILNELERCEVVYRIERKNITYYRFNSQEHLMEVLSQLPILGEEEEEEEEGQ